MTDLKTELQQNLPFSSPQEEATLNIMRTHERLQLAFTRLFRTHGLSQAQYNILRILRGAGEKGLPGSAIRQRLLACVPDITRLIDRLEKARWVCRVRCCDDRRVVYIQITSEGRRLLEQLDVPVRELNFRQLSHLDDDELRTLITLLEKARAGVDPADSCSEEND